MVVMVVVVMPVGAEGVGEAVWGRGGVEEVIVGRGGWGEKSCSWLVLQARVVLEGVLKVADVVDHVLNKLEARNFAVLRYVRYNFPEFVEVVAHLGLDFSTSRVAVRASASLPESTTTSSSSSATTSATSNGTHIIACRTHHFEVFL